MIYFQKIDLWVIENIFESIAHWTQTNYGVTCFTLARVCTVGFVVCAFIVINFGHDLDDVISMLRFSTFVLLMYAILSLVTISIAEKATLGSSSRGYSNPFRGIFMMRLPFLSVSLFLGLFFCVQVFLQFGLIYLIVMIIFILLLNFTSYFFACNPLPPSMHFVPSHAQN